MLASEEKLGPQVKEVQKEKKGYRFFFFDDIQISIILKELQYPKLQQYCYHCSKEVTLHNSLACHVCFKYVHKQCNTLLNQSRLQMCRFCANDMCLKCKITFFKYQRKVKCSICLKNEHIQCWNMPFQLNQHTNKFYNHLKYKMAVCNRIVCQQCQLLWGTSPQIMMNVVVSDKRYFLVQVNHPSPIHYTWQTEQQYQLMRQRNIQLQELVIYDNKKPTIESIFSINLSSNYNSVSLGCIYKLLQEAKIQNDIYKDKVYFLVKWQDREQLVWQTFQTVRPYEVLIRNFFIQLNMNWMKAKKTQHQEMSSYIQNLILDESVPNKANFLGNKMMKEDEEKQSSYSLLQKLYDLYCKTKKQSLLSKNRNQSNKVSLLCSLINTILFVKKQFRPIFLFTPRNNLKRWFNNLAKYCPFHKCLMVSGSEKYLRTIMSKHFCSFRHKKQIFYNSIYLFDYDSFEIIISFFSFKQFINISTLLIMQEKMSFLARHLYDQCGVAKIKLGTKNTENTISLDINSLSDKSNISFQNTLSNPNKVHYYEFIQLTLKNTLSQASTIYINQLFRDSLLNELQKVSFLRFIMLFGLQSQNSQKFITELYSFDRSTFSTQDDKLISLKIQTYVKKFLAVVYTSLSSKQLPNQLIKFFCFEIEPYQIFERLILINQLKKIVKKYTKEPRTNIADTYTKQAFVYCTEFNLMICEAIVTKGFGRWQSISEYSKVWQEGIAQMSLRQYFCLKTGLSISQLGFCQLIKDRLIKFGNYIKKTNYLS